MTEVLGDDQAVLAPVRLNTWSLPAVVAGLVPATPMSFALCSTFGVAGTSFAGREIRRGRRLHNPGPGIKHRMF